MKGFMKVGQAEIKKITYYGPEVAELLDEALKIVTLRRPASKYDLDPGERATAQCPDSKESVEMVVVDNAVSPLRGLSIPSLLLDGYASPEAAAADLTQYYGEVDIDSLMQRIATLPDYVWDGLSREQQELFLELGLDGAMKEPAFRAIFMPALLFWFMELSENDSSIQAWHEWLVKNELVSPAEIEKKMNVDPTTRAFYDALLASDSSPLLYPRDSVFFQSVFLHQALSVSLED